MRPVLACLLAAPLLVGVGCGPIVRLPADGGGGAGAGGTDASSSSSTGDTSTSGTGAAPTHRELDVRVVAGGYAWRPMFPVPEVTVFSSDAQGALVDSTTTADGGVATLTVEDGGLVTAVELYAYGPSEEDATWTHVAKSRLVTEGTSSMQLVIEPSWLGVPPGAPMLVQIEIPPMEEGWNYVLDDGCYVGETVEPGTVMVERVVGAADCQMFGAFGSVTVSLWRDQGAGTTPELVSSAATRWEPDTMALLDLTLPITWVDATMTISGEDLPSLQGSWRLTSWELAPVEMSSSSALVVSAPHPSWISTLDAPIPFFVALDSECPGFFHGQRSFEGGQLELAWPELARIESDGETWDVVDGAPGDYVNLYTSTTLSFEEVMWWYVDVPTSQQGYVPPWLEAPAELSSESAEADVLFRNVQEEPTPWRVREHVDYVGLAYEDVVAMGFDGMADGVVRLESSCSTADLEGASD